MEKFEDFWPKIGNWNFLNVYRKICEYKRSRLFFDL